MYTPWVKKTRHQTLVHIFAKIIDRFSKFFHRYTWQEICNKAIITDPNTPQKLRYTTLWNIKLFNIWRSYGQEFNFDVLFLWVTV